MSLYYHVANKDEILDGMVDAVFGEIELPPTILTGTADKR
jgi:AcrR family transcriptional regulator